MVLLTPSSPGGLPTLSLTTNSSWLPWASVAMPLLSPVMTVLQDLVEFYLVNSPLKSEYSKKYSIHCYHTVSSPVTLAP